MYPNNDKNNKKEIGVLTEQGDLGLGWNPLNESDSNKYENRPDNKDKKDNNK